MVFSHKKLFTRRKVNYLHPSVAQFALSRQKKCFMRAGIFLSGITCSPFEKVYSQRVCLARKLEGCHFSQILQIGGKEVLRMAWTKTSLWCQTFALVLTQRTSPSLFAINHWILGKITVHQTHAYNKARLRDIDQPLKRSLYASTRHKYHHRSYQKFILKANLDR